MWVGIVSDTHGHETFTTPAAHILRSFSVEHVIHCGDIGGGRIVEIFASWPTHYVYGNTDDDRSALEDAISRRGGTYHGPCGNITLSGVNIAWTHGDDVSLLTRLVRSQKYDLVCHGHTHKSNISTQGRTLIINPGALYRAQHHSIAVVNLSTMEHHILNVT